MEWPALADNVFFEQLHFSVRKFLLKSEGKSLCRFVECIGSFLFYSLGSYWTNLISSFTLEALEIFFKDGYHIPQVFRLKKKISISSTGSHMKLFWDFFPSQSLSWVWYYMKKGRLKDDLIGTFKCQGNCHTEEAGKIFAITTETRNDRLIPWLKRFRYQETCLNLIDWDSAVDCHGKFRGSLALEIYKTNL